jgi:ABC-2 type transport system permease protein
VPDSGVAATGHIAARPATRRVLWAFLVRELREAASYKAAFVLGFAGLLLALAALYYLSRFVQATGNPRLLPYGADYLGFIVLGFVLTELQQVAVGAFSNRVRSAQLAGTLEAMLATPARPWQILLAAPVGDFLEALTRSVGYLLLAVLAFGMRFHGAHLGAALAAFVLGMGSFAGLGLLSAAATMYLRKGEPIGLLVSGLSVLTAGVIYPTSILPVWLRRVGEALPVTHALEAVRRALLGGAGLAELAPTLATLAAFTLVLVPIGLSAFLLALRRARIDGSLTHY